MKFKITYIFFAYISRIAVWHSWLVLHLIEGLPPHCFALTPALKLSERKLQHGGKFPVSEGGSLLFGNYI